MNKKGFISMTWLFMIILVLVVLAMAQNGIDNSTINKTIDNLNWTALGGKTLISLQNSADNASNPIAKSLINIVTKVVDTVGYGIMEVSKLAMAIARDNPDMINYKVLFVLLMLCLIAPLIYPLFIIIVSLILIIREAYLNRKDRRRSR
jgi:hypothetical protein